MFLVLVIIIIITIIIIISKFRRENLASWLDEKHRTILPRSGGEPPTSRTPGFTMRKESLRLYSFDHGHPYDPYAQYNTSVLKTDNFYGWH
jgi:hypothetical protein